MRASYNCVEFDTFICHERKETGLPGRNKDSIGAHGFDAWTGSRGWDCLGLLAQNVCLDAPSLSKRIQFMHALHGLQLHAVGWQSMAFICVRSPGACAWLSHPGSTGAGTLPNPSDAARAGGRIVKHRAREGLPTL